MQYLLFIYSNEAEYDARPQAEAASTMAEYGAFTQGIIQNGNYKVVSACGRSRPQRPWLDERVEGMLATIYLVFTEGYAPTTGYELLREELSREGSGLAACCAS